MRLGNYLRSVGFGTQHTCMVWIALSPGSPLYKNQKTGESLESIFQGATSRTESVQGDRVNLIVHWHTAQTPRVCFRAKSGTNWLVTRIVHLVHAPTLLRWLLQCSHLSDCPLPTYYDLVRKDTRLSPIFIFYRGEKDGSAWG